MIKVNNLFLPTYRAFYRCLTFGTAILVGSLAAYVFNAELGANGIGVTMIGALAGVIIWLLISGVLRLADVTGLAKNLKGPYATIEAENRGGYSAEVM